MNDRWPPYSAVQPVDLARVADFALGDMCVRPSACEIEIEGQAERLEPRVMKVLAALSRAKGEVVSREDLIVSCWGGAIIGDDAINRVLGKLRRLSERCVGRSFRVDTVPKIGYRLIADVLSRADRRAAPWNGQRHFEFVAFA